MKASFLNKIITLVVLCFFTCQLFAQRPVIRPPQGAIPNVGGVLNRGAGSGTGDSLRRRDRSDDSLRVRYTYLDSVGTFFLDTTINDFTSRFPIPAHHVSLGNNGTATRSYLFMHRSLPGWDHGFHSLDVYRWKLEQARFYNTRRPFTELSYMLGSRAEQIIEILHTQNIKSNWNASFNYRLINAPGFFRNQRTNHNNYLFTSGYQSPSKRYNNYLIFLNNKLQAGENGGILQDKDYLNDPVYSLDRFSIPTFLGGAPTYGTDFFSTSLYTGRREKDLHIMVRQQYDLGRKDSLITDSVVVPLFYPRLRFEHNFKFSKYNFLFQDYRVNDNKQSNLPDTNYYSTRYNLAITNDSLLLQDQWQEINNSFFIYQFPDVNNLQQYLKFGAELQLLRGQFKSSNSFYNMIGRGEYRNRTKNQKWDLTAFGKLFFSGLNAGDYHAYTSLQRNFAGDSGKLMLGFENINKSPSFIFNQLSSFYLDGPKDFRKENIIHFFASVQEPRFNLRLTGDYFILSNYLYLQNFRQLMQESALFNVLRVGASKTFRISNFWRLYSDVHLQQKTGAAALNLPLFFTRNRIAFEGLFFRNLNLSTGAEIRYHSPYKADNYSPVLGQFFYQNTITINNRPDITAFLHFRIRSFKAYIRAENLNTMSFSNGEFGFNKNNLASPGYPMPGLVFRLGIYWGFVN